MGYAGANRHTGQNSRRDIGHMWDIFIVSFKNSRYMKLSVNYLVDCLPSFYRVFDDGNKDTLAISYLKMYPHFISYLENAEQIGKQEFIVAAGFTYSWMRASLKLHIEEEKLNKAIKVLQEVRLIDSFDKAKNIEVSHLKKVVSNSYIGASKLLHFVNPDCFPIYDSNICKKIFNNCVEQHHVNTKKRFTDYFDQITGCICQPDFNSKLYVPVIKTMLANNLSSVTPLRAAEMVLFFRARES
jgi:hypothetical protein